MRIEVVILHYQNSKDTFSCVDSLMSMSIPDGMSIHVIIIDNGSPNGSGKEITKKYADNSRVEVILLKDNLGFSKANNIGYEKARSKKPDAIIMSNNDIIFNDENFLYNLAKSLKEYKNAAIICPDIVNLKNQHQNPMREKPLSMKSVKKGLNYRRAVATLMRIPVIRALVYKVDKRRFTKWEEKYYPNNINCGLGFNMVPYGAFIIYAKKWIDNEKIAFPSGTFMYMEEDFLAQYVEDRKYRIVYDKDLKVKHLEGGSTSTMKKDDKYNALRAKYEKQADAMKKYKDYMESKI